MRSFDIPFTKYYTNFGIACNFHCETHNGVLGVIKITKNRNSHINTEIKVLKLINQLSRRPIFKSKCKSNGGNPDEAEACFTC